MTERLNIRHIRNRKLRAALQGIAAACLVLLSGVVCPLQSQAIVNSGAAIVVSSGTYISSASMTNTSGTLANNGSMSITTLANGGTVQGNGSYTIANTFTNTGTFTCGTSTVTFTGASLTIPALSYNNLTLANTGLKTFAAGTIGIAGTISVTGGATVDALANSVTVNYNGTGAQTVGAMKYYNLTISNSGTSAVTLIAGDTIFVSNLFTNSASGASFVSTNNTFYYNGSSAQTVTPFTYNTLILGGGSTKTVAASQTANGDVIQIAGTALVVDNAIVWTIKGNLSIQDAMTNNGAITVGP